MNESIKAQEFKKGTTGRMEWCCSGLSEDAQRKPSTQRGPVATQNKVVHYPNSSETSGSQALREIACACEDKEAEAGVECEAVNAGCYESGEKRFGSQVRPCRFQT